MNSQHLSTADRTKSRSVITRLGVAVPPHRLEAQQGLAFLEACMAVDEQDRRKLHALSRRSGIQYRHSVLPLEAPDDPRGGMYPNGGGYAPGTARRMGFFAQHAGPLALQAVQEAGLTEDESAATTHLVTVSCTGMAAPGLDFELIERLKLSPSVQRTNIHFMGCYALFNALRVADGICAADPCARVLVVSVELCTLHFQPDATDSNLLANLLFADGAAALLVQAEAPGLSGLRLERFASRWFPDTAEHMGWHLSDAGFQMQLSNRVPEALAGSLPEFVEQFLGSQGHPPGETRLAVHPGGARIVRAVAEALGYDKEECRAALSVLAHYGNMSSPTIAFVLKEMMQQAWNAEHPRAFPWLAMAFGPGLCVEAALIQPLYD